MINELVYFFPEGHDSHFSYGHPERPERINAIKQALIDLNLWDVFPKITPIEIPENILYSVHNQDYIDQLIRFCGRELWLDQDTYTTRKSYEIALKSAGGAAAIAESVWLGNARSGFAITRPPGHHAMSYKGMGFCLLNNIAVAAKFLLDQYRVKKIAIIDLDLHHGNGTQEIFWSEKRVFFISIHQAPFYPGTGNFEEVGAGNGLGTNANFPVPAGSGDQTYHSIIHQLVIPILSRYRPEIILVSYGFDCHWRDPLGGIELSAKELGEVVYELSEWSKENCDGKIALFLEGGYDLLAAAACSQAVVSGLIGLDFTDPLGETPNEETMYSFSMLTRAKKFWNL